MSRRSWTRRRELVSRTETAAGVLAAVLLAGFDRPWWLRQMIAPLLNVAGWACVVIAAVFVWAAEYPSAVLAAAVAVASWLGWFVLRPPESGGAR